jgi:23S rRNA (guanosine2251-2'-O)-methyltransferase
MQQETVATDLLIGRNPIREALKAGRAVNKLYVAKGELSATANQIIAAAREAGAVVQFVDRRKLDQMAPSHQGLIAQVAAISYSELSEIIEDAKNADRPALIVVLDGVTDPNNLGAILRTAECCGAQGVVIEKRNAAGVTYQVEKAASGALNYIKVARVVNITRAIAEIKKAGIWTYAADMDGQSLFQTDLSGDVCLVIGDEGAGVSRLVKQECDHVVSLPVFGHVQSLNASVAAGVLLYAAVKARL